jgi:anaerobic selenocysteine-containing dehydrogenase
MTKKEQGHIGRRDFLRAMGASASAGLAMAAALTLATQVQAAESEQEAKKARYDANSEDVKNFYRVNRY